MQDYLCATALVSCVAACSGRSTTPTADSELANAPRIAASPEVDASGGGTVTLTGTRGGLPLSARGAVALFASYSSPGIPSLVVVGMPESFDLTCDLLRKEATRNIEHSNSAQLTLQIETGGPPVVPGVYRVASPDAGGGSGAVGMTAGGWYEQLDGDCGTTSPETATSGIVVVSAIDRTAISGSFDLAFPNGDFARGQFSAPVCVVPLFYDGPPVDCVP